MKTSLSLALCLLASSFGFADPGTLTIHVDRPLHKVSPDFYGLMTEEINHAYDGGLYGELIRNRAFKDDPQGPAFWSTLTGAHAETMYVDAQHPVPNTALTDCLRIDLHPEGNGRAGVANEGFWGIPVRPNTTYRASLYARLDTSITPIHGPITVDIESNDGTKIWASAEIPGLTSEWKKFEVKLKTSQVPESTTNRFVISARAGGAIWITGVSLFPPTFKNRPNGNRIDLMQSMRDLNPTFLRLPGGNYLEGNSIAERFEFKDTIGDIFSRPGHPCPWGYRSSDGLGLLEYLEWCEDLHMNPLLAVFAGYALRGQHIDAGPALQPYVQDALDEIEYVSGDPGTKWGAERARNGHPKPFRLTYVEVGNEDWFDRSGSYDGRFTQFYDAIKAKYPKLQIIATAKVKLRTPDIYDDHYYRTAAEMAQDATHYDKLDRKGPKIFVGEWASLEGEPTPDFKAALGDAAWMTGMERNSDLVIMEAYAPLFINVNPGAAQWNTNLIGYDALHSFKSPSFYVQALFGQNTGDQELPVDLDVKVPDQALPFRGAIGVGINPGSDAEFKDVEVTSGGKVLYRKDFANGASDWVGRGEPVIEDGALHIKDTRGTRFVAGDSAWENYTLHLKAKKLGGANGFQLLFHAIDNRNVWQWNVGGVGSKESSIQHIEVFATKPIGKPVPFSLVTGQWYDLRVEVQSGRVSCYIDDHLIQEVDEAPKPMTPLYACASKVGRSGELILKVVNFSSNAAPMRLDLGGSKTSYNSTGWLLTGALEDRNSLTNPEKISPKPLPAGTVKAGAIMEFPPYSVTVIRLKPN